MIFMICLNQNFGVFKANLRLIYLNKLATKIKNGTDIAKIITNTSNKHIVEVKNFFLLCFMMTTPFYLVYLL